jgi:formylglycine-generating enzyme required for sulfatase activity
MGNNPSHFQGDNLPVERVRWYDAVEYCNRRSEREGLTPAYRIDKNRKDPNNQAPTGDKNDWENDRIRWTVTWDRNANGYRLPTEAEWEYACRAGTSGPFNTGNNITTSQANYNGDYVLYLEWTWKEWVTRQETITVGSFAANPWGLYDMHGNVEEWCWDWYGGYTSGAQTDPAGASTGACRVVRGGSRSSIDALFVRSAVRLFTYTPSYRYFNLGFRLVRP